MSIKITELDVRPAEKAEKNRMYIFIDNEKIMDNLMNRFSRPSDFYKKEVIPLVLEKLKKKNPDVYKKVKDAKWTWNQYAGCSCGCSPGFIGNTKDRLEFYVTFKNTTDAKKS